MKLQLLSQQLKNNDHKFFYSENNTTNYSLSNEALFQLPLLSLIILTFAKGKKKPLVGEIGQLVGEVIEKSFLSFKGSSQLLGWSTNMRLRVIDALHFLQTSNLIEVKKNKITATTSGAKVINSTLKNTDDDLAIALLKIEENYINICSIRQLELELY